MSERKPIKILLVVNENERGGSVVGDKNKAKSPATKEKEARVKYILANILVFLILELINKRSDE